jgi:uncharacterized protein (TIGR03790 family)
MSKILSVVVLATLIAQQAFAIGPHEVVLIANANSPQSLKVAREYATLRGVPTPNIVILEGLTEDCDLSISLKQFKAIIWIPVSKVLKERNLEDTTFAWIYSTDFPTTISTTPKTSLTGMTFLRGATPPDADVIDNARYASPLFADPVSPSTKGFRSRSFDRLKSITGRDMPLPAFMLGYTGARGNTPNEVISYLKNGVLADHSSPSGTVYFVTSEDIRSASRAWQFKPTILELSRLNVDARLVKRVPDGTRDIMGILMGAAEVDTKKVGAFLPGAFAEHLTSFGAFFENKAQTKCTEWLSAGAVGTAGTITEPYSGWPKFPHARLFVHYASGCTLIESFYQSVRCPLQTLPIGDPLCQPWAPEPDIKIEGLPDSPVSAPFTCSAIASYEKPTTTADIEWYVDDTYISNGEEALIDTKSLAAGGHSLKVIARIHGPIRSQGFLVRQFKVSAK